MSVPVYMVLLCLFSTSFPINFTHRRWIWDWDRNKQIQFSLCMPSIFNLPSATPSTVSYNLSFLKAPYVTTDRVMWSAILNWSRHSLRGANDESQVLQQSSPHYIIPCTCSKIKSLHKASPITCMLLTLGRYFYHSVCVLDEMTGMII